MRLQNKYWSIAKRLTTAQLQKNSGAADFQLEDELFNVNIGRRGGDLFLGYYSKEGLRLVFEKYGVFDALKRLGYDPLVFKVDTDDPYVHKISLYYKEKDPKRLLAEVVLKREILTIAMPFNTALNGRKYETLSIEWLAMQKPGHAFLKKRPRLPGQQYPGLGLASRAVELLLITAWRLKLSGLLNTPQYYHNAYLYSKIFFYINPEHQAKLKAMQRDLANYSLDQVAWALEWGAVKEKNTALPFKWFPGRQIVPLEENLKKLFNSRAYRQLVKTQAKNYCFELDIKKYRQIRMKKGEQYEA